MAELEMICILCPLGCKAQVSEKEDRPGELKVRGIQCGKGRDYFHEEYKNPTRTLTSTVVIHNAPLPRLPVKTSKPLPKALLYDAMAVIDEVEVSAPVTMGDIIVRDLLGSEIDVIASRSMQPGNNS